ncbi:hypothetical protein [Microbacterium sp. SLBN-146]|uniref:hypothetical protein n=1 Tax=Microbacterium sp. SLBN-146 TaxID=2768457 RepID=UPI001153B794|nr:hypothetical protein [Microbacterium sp. SLBN-146]TQJ31994.1 hypothetical protein FBY39_2487 [Microbacterium sp. SLBN-146]
MSAITIESPAEMPRPADQSRLRLTPAGPSLWRVSNEQGRIIGHLGTRVDEQGVRYVARRFHVSTAGFRDLGEFWSPDDALQCLRYGA